MKKEKNFSKTLKKQQQIFKIFFLSIFLIITISNKSFSDVLKPNKNISPKEVVKIQLNALMKNDRPYKDRGILQTWEFAHPKNKSFTGPYDKFKNMIKKDSYSILINHKSHEVKEMFKNENVATYEVVILGKDKKFYKFKWQVEKYNKEGPLKNCWLTTAVLAPKVLGSSV